MGADGLFEASENAEDRHKRARKIIAQLIGFDLDPNILVGDLPLSIKQWITIARSILTDPKLLILDESSAALDFDSTERLFSKMRLMQSKAAQFYCNPPYCRINPHCRPSNGVKRWKISWKIGETSNQ